jgi:hypothetical protein
MRGSGVAEPPRRLSSGGDRSHPIRRRGEFGVKSRCRWFDTARLAAKGDFASGREAEREGTHMIIRSLGVALLWIAIAAIPAAAQDGADYARTGPYMGGGLALGWENFDGAPGGFDTGVGFDVWAGHRFHPNFAAEFEIEYVDRVNVATIDTNLLTFTGNLKAYLATGRCQPFALVGIGVTRFGIDAGVLGSGSESAFGARFGGGFDYYLTEILSLGTTASYVVGTSDLDGADYVSLVMGAQLRF